MPAEVFSLHGTGAAGLESVKPEKKRVLKYEKGAKRPVDEQAPKKPLSAYFQWAADNRPKIAKKNKDLGLTEITKKLGDMWKNLPADKKSKYEEKAKKEQNAYKCLLGAYKLTSAHKKFEKELRDYQIMMTYKPFRKDENMPKRALSAYMLFQQEKRPSLVEEHPDAKVTEIMKLVAEAWKELSEKDKEPFQKKSKQLAAKHAKELEKYKTSKKYQEYLADKKEYEAKMKTKREKLEKDESKAQAKLGAGSGASPKPKRRKTDAKKEEPKAKTSASKKPKKKTSEPKKKADPKKKKSDSKKQKSDPKKKKSAPKAKKASPKKKSAPRKAAKNKKAVKEPKRSVKKKARKAVVTKKKSKK